ncbi:hypothetical protein NitYY0918_C1134 [Nitratiruptor sp. YY09-18]|nr:hypothetical protein NitYY0918_C1134 [Nitratiruptor sp. YY09-18]
MSAAKTTDKDVEKFVKRGLSSNPQIKVYNAKVLDKKEMEKPQGWTAYVVQFDIGIKRGNKEQNITDRDIIFVNERYVAPDLVDIKTNTSLKQRVVLDFKDRFYDDKHLLYGHKNAKHKIVVFSDPLCPFCREVVPELIELTKKYPDTFVLYYYHLPIQTLHPASVALAKAIIYLKEHGNKEAIEKIYKTEFDYAQKDEKKTLQELDKKLGIKLTPQQINSPEVITELQHDADIARELMIKGTPTVFIDNKYDPRREKYKKFIPKKSK